MGYVTIELLAGIAILIGLLLIGGSLTPNEEADFVTARAPRFLRSSA